MKFLWLSPLSVLPLFMACGGSGEDEAESQEPSPALVVPEISFDLDTERLLSSLADDEINAACEVMDSVFTQADEGVACQIVAAAETSTADCEAKRDECLEEPAEALLWTDVRSAPADVDCTLFDSSLTEGCDFPVSLLEDCVNALAQSVVPSAEAVHCQNAAEISDYEEADHLATVNEATDFVTICVDLLACESLVAALLEPSSLGAGGAPN